MVSAAEFGDPVLLLQDFLSQPHGLAVLFLLGIALALFAYKRYFEGEEHFEGTTLEERTYERFNDIIRTLGTNIQRELRYGFKKLGVIDRHYKLWVYEPISKQDKSGDDEEEEKEKMRVNFFLVRPAFKLYDPFSYLSWFVSDRILGRDWLTDMYAIPHKYMANTDFVEIDSNLSIARIANIYVPRSEEGIEIVMEEAFLDLIEDLGERFSNNIELMNYLDQQFTKNIQQMEKETELDMKRWGDREASAVEGS